MKHSLAVIGLVVMLLLAACGAPVQQTDTGVYIDSKVDPNVYTLSLQLEKQESHETSNAYLSGYSFGGYGGVSGRFWQEGKGLLRGTVVSLEPDVSFAERGNLIVIKTTDLKVMGLLPGDVVKFACTVDFEPVCAKNEVNRTVTGDCVEIWEFDFCRIIEILPDKG